MEPTLTQVGLLLHRPPALGELVRAMGMLRVPRGSSCIALVDLFDFLDLEEPPRCVTFANRAAVVEVLEEGRLWKELARGGPSSEQPYFILAFVTGHYVARAELEVVRISTSTDIHCWRSFPVGRAGGD